MGSIYKEYPKSVDPKDFWVQIKRTVNGRAVSENQIALIVSAINESLQFVCGDHLLDLACGNGALSQYFFNQLSGFHGVDFSEPLISVAKDNFEQSGMSFELADVGEYIIAEKNPQIYTKALCYGSFSYFSETTARLVLTTLNRKFCNVQQVFIGNLPDLNRQELFYTDRDDHQHELKVADSVIGIWRTEGEFCQLAKECGWQAEIKRMPANFYAAHYRYDALLTRPAKGEID